LKLKNSFSVDLPIETAWKILLDIPAVVPCMPGAELLAVEDERSYRGQMKVKLGPVAVAFQGRARLTEVDEIQHLVRVAASGTEGKGRGSAQAEVIFRLVPEDQTTRVDIDTDLSLAGAVAQYGRAQGVIADVSQVMVDAFAQNLRRRIAASPSSSGSGSVQEIIPSANAPAPALSLFSLLAALIRRWFSGAKGK
jgi:carbon monoxide dehydrogenase subunit G